MWHNKIQSDALFNMRRVVSFKKRKKTDHCKMQNELSVLWGIFQAFEGILFVAENPGLIALKALIRC